MNEPNQATEIYQFIANRSVPVSIEDIVEGTGWNRHVVEVAVKIMLAKDLVEESGQKSGWGDPLYRATRQRRDLEDTEAEPDHSDIVDETRG